ncbi:site-specific integrase [uncultured Muribaculum sp.]|jgi:site-specific recombinase XerD|uniref:site-specific integrase n=1 Tax=uncultured Muribaculum sp. TaxID=1918613 RepID=UPI0025A68259|nr:site-specific integrase [uncultured Muribaculum sp.]
MAIKKNYRADNTYLISTDTTDNPKLGAKVLNDGRESLFLDFYFGYSKVFNEKTGKETIKKNRRREYLSLYLWQAPRTQLERQQNKELLEIAKKIRFEREQELKEDKLGYRLKKEEVEINYLDFMAEYHASYTKKDANQIRRARTVFIDFLIDPKGKLLPGKITGSMAKEEKEAIRQSNAKKEAQRERKAQGLVVRPQQLTKDLMKAFTEYLINRFTGEGAHTVYGRFKKMILAALDKDIIAKNPCRGVSIKKDYGQLKKEILSQEEIVLLANTHYEKENPDIHRAFIFCLYCGLRWCDVKDLTYANVDYSNKLLKFEQSKTKAHSAASGVVIPLNDGLLHLIGQPKDGNRNQIIFPLPSHTMCLKALRHWVARAGIEKHITWHCARHSCGTNLLSNGANIKTVASILGHSGLSHTEKYTRAVDSLKQAAIDSMPPLNL